MRPALALAPLLSLLVGCGDAPAPPPPPAPKAPALAKPTPPPPPPAPAPTGRALLVASEFGLSPLACYLDQTRAFATGDACLALAPAGAELWLVAAARAAKVTGFGATSCPDAAPQPTLKVEAEAEALRGDAVVPLALKDALTYTPPTRPEDVDRAAPKELRKRLALALTAAFPTLGAVKPRVEQRAELDLDGDGALEVLIAVTVPAARGEDDAVARAAALFIERAGALTLLRGGEGSRARYTVLGALDLDGDGHRELYLNTYDDEGFALTLERLGEGGLEALGRWSCGA